MNILILCVTNYYSGTAEQFFKSPLENIGHKVSIASMSDPGVEGFVMSEVEKGNVDLIFHIPYPNKFRREIIQHITKNTKTITLGWMGDDEWLWGASDPHSPKVISFDYDYCVTTSRVSIKQYKKIGYENVILGQWGFARNDWNPTKRKKQIDVYFCGARNPDRDVYIKSLMDAKINIVIDGLEYGITSYPKFDNTKYESENGNMRAVKAKLPFSEMVDRTRMAKIGLNFNFGRDKKGQVYEQIKARTFEIPACGTFQLTFGSSELCRFLKPGKEVETFSSPKEMIQKIIYYLKHETERERIAKKGHEANKSNSYENIFRNILKQVKK